LEAAFDELFPFFARESGLDELGSIAVAPVDVGASDWTLDLGWERLCLCSFDLFFSEFPILSGVVLKVEVMRVRFANYVIEDVDFRCARAGRY
jgi:hypothetical protein